MALHLDDLGLDVDRIVKFQNRWFQIRLMDGTIIYCGDAAALNSFAKVDAAVAQAIPGGMLPQDLRRDWRHYAALIGSLAVNEGKPG